MWVARIHPRIQAINISLCLLLCCIRTQARQPNGLRRKQRSRNDVILSVPDAAEAHAAGRRHRNPSHSFSSRKTRLLQRFCVAVRAGRAFRAGRSVEQISRANAAEKRPTQDGAQSFGVEMARGCPTPTRRYNKPQMTINQRDLCRFSF